MTTHKEALTLALEALKRITHRFDLESVTEDATKAITAAEEALAQPEQEPSFWLSTLDVETETPIVISHADKTQGSIYADTCIYHVYTTPPQRTWVGLTNEEELQLAGMTDKSRHWLVAAVEAKLKEKNT